MTTYPAITVQICTYKRPAEIRQCVAALEKHLIYSGKIELLICDDSTGGTYLDDLARDLQTCRFPVKIIKTQQNSGWGANVNHGLLFNRNPYILFTEDDYILKKDIDLNALIDLMEEEKSIGLMRLDGITGHALNMHLREVNIKARNPNYKQGLGMSAQGVINVCIIDAHSPHLNVYSNRPHLKRRDFHHFFGLYPQGLKLGETEEAFAHTVKDYIRMYSDLAPVIGCLPEHINNMWDDIGVSFQHTEEDK